MMPRDVVSAPLWYALAVEMGWETHVRDELAPGDDAERPGILPPTDVCLLIEEIRMPSRGRGPILPVQRPFIDGYLFVRADLDRISAKSIEGARGAIKLVRGATGGTNAPTPMNGRAIEALRRLEDHDGVIRAKQAIIKLFDRGQRVRIDRGDEGEDKGFAGYLAEIVAAHGSDRMKVLINGSRQVTLPMRLLVPVPA